MIAGLEPILAHHFNLTVELLLKAIIRGYTYAIIPISWTNRASGVSKLKIHEMGSRYLFIVIYCFIERLLSRGTYRRKLPPKTSLEGFKKDVPYAIRNSGHTRAAKVLDGRSGDRP